MAVFETSGLAAGVPAGAAPRPPRKNVMLAGSISSGAAQAPVRIRNLSELGAMIDGPSLPTPGCTLTLNRLALSIRATVVWTCGGRCGLRLDGVIVVDDWIAGAITNPARAAAAQFRVDQIQSAVRSGAVLPAETRAPAVNPADIQPVERSVAAELCRVRRMLDAVTEELSDDVDVLGRHERAMQNFDIAAQIIAELAVVLAADDREAAVGAVHMHDLRSRLSGRLTLT
jgi:hypothetical protein